MNIKLQDYDPKFAKKVTGIEEISKPDPKTYHTIYADDKPAGIVGYKGEGFVQIALNEEYRGKGITPQAYKEMAKEHGLKKLYASIRHDNPQSMQSHLKAGFKELPKKRLEYLRKKKFLGPASEGTRLEKNAVKIDFPKEEHSDIKNRLHKNQQLITHRYSVEADKFKNKYIVDSKFGKLKIVKKKKLMDLYEDNKFKGDGEFEKFKDKLKGRSGIQLTLEKVSFSNNIYNMLERILSGTLL